jgi:hypothetical protein
VQFKGVAVDTLPGARERGAHGLHAFLQPAAAPLEDPQSDIGAGLAEEREVHPEPVVFPRGGTGLGQQVLQPLLAIGGQPVDNLGPPPGARPRRVLVGLLRDQTLGEKFLQARVERPVGEGAEGTKHGVETLAQLVAVHGRAMQQPEHGKFKHAVTVATHVSPLHTRMPAHPYDRPMYLADVSYRCIGSIHRSDYPRRGRMASLR